MARKRIGEVLVERGLITPPQLDAALGYQRHGSGRIGTTLVALGALSEGQLTVALGEHQGLPVVDLAREPPEWRALHLLRSEFCEKHLVLPLSLDEDERGRRVLRLAVADGLDLPTIDAIEYQANCKVVALLAGASQIRAAIARWYRGNVPRDFAEGDEMVLIRPGGGTETVRTATTAEPLVEEEIEVEEAQVLPLATELPQPSRAAAIFREDYEFLFGAPKKDDAVAQLERRILGLASLLERKGLCSRQELEGALGIRLPRPGHA